MYFWFPSKPWILFTEWNDPEYVKKVSLYCRTPRYVFYGDRVEECFRTLLKKCRKKMAKDLRITVASDIPLGITMRLECEPSSENITVWAPGGKMFPNGLSYSVRIWPNSDSKITTHIINPYFVELYPMAVATFIDRAERTFEVQTAFPPHSFLHHVLDDIRRHREPPLDEGSRRGVALDVIRSHMTPWCRAWKEKRRRFAAVMTELRALPPGAINPYFPGGTDYHAGERSWDSFWSSYSD